MPKTPYRAAFRALAVPAVLAALAALAAPPAAAAQETGPPEARDAVPAAEAPPAETAAAPADVDDNEEIVRRFTAEVYNDRQLDAIPRYVAESFVDHSPGVPPGPHGPDFVRAQAEQTFAGMPDIVFAVEHLFSEGDMVAMHWRAKGTASAEFAGGASEGRQIDVEGISLFRMEDGKVVESWDIVDRLTLFQQAGFRIAPPAVFRSPPEEATPEPAPAPTEPEGGRGG